jgi:outer membrane receptor protein involved in Fe transport
LRLTVTPLALLALGWACDAHAQASGRPSKPAGTQVQGLVVTAQRPQAQTLIDRQVYTVTTDLQATTGSAADVLNNVPAVDVDADGNVSLRGDSNVTVLIDGEPSAQFAGATRGESLLQLQASDIDRIEVLTNPPAQYKAEGSAGVINIITKKTRKAGLSGTARASGGDAGRFVLGLDVNYNTGRLKLSGGVGLRRDIRERLSTSHRLETDPVSGVVTQSDQAIDEHFRRLTPSVQGAIDYGLSARQSIGASFSHRELTGHRFFDQDDLSGPPGGPVASDSNRHSDGHEWHLDAGEEAHFEQKLGRPGETLTLAVQRSVTSEREGYAYRNTFALPPAPPTFDDLHLGLDLVKLEVTADYDLPLAGDRELKLGYDLETDRNAFDNRGDTIDPASGQPVVNPNVTNDFRYRQAVNAGYGEYEAPLGPWRLQAGLRVEATRVWWLQITGGLSGGRRDLAVYPSLSLERSLGESGKLTAAVSRRVTRPDPEALNPFTDHQDTHNLRAGNPNLRPQDTWSAKLGYVFTGRALTGGASAYYRIDRDGVTDVVQSLGGGVTLATKANLPLSRSAGFDFNVNGKLGRQLTYALSGDAFETQIDAAALGTPGLRSTAGINLKASLDYRPTPLDTAQISVSRTDKRLTPQGFVSAIDLVNLGYKRQLRPDLTLVVTVSDVLDGQKFRRITTAPQLSDDYLRHQIGRIAYVGLVYTFGAPAKAKPTGFDYDQ